MEEKKEGGGEGEEGEEGGEGTAAESLGPDLRREESLCCPLDALDC